MIEDSQSVAPLLFNLNCKGKIRLLFGTPGLPGSKKKNWNWNCVSPTNHSVQTPSTLNANSFQPNEMFLAQFYSNCLNVMVLNKSNLTSVM